MLKEHSIPKEHSSNGKRNTREDPVQLDLNQLLKALTAVHGGDFSVRIPLDYEGVNRKVAVTLNELIEMKQRVTGEEERVRSFASQETRVAREVGTEGKLGGQAQVKGVAGVWKDLTVNLNSMASSLTAQVRDIAQITTAVAQGDLTKKITVNVKGEILQ